MNVTAETSIINDWRKWNGQEHVTLHAKESTVAFEKLGKKATRLIQETADPTVHPSIFLGGKRVAARHKLRADDAFSVALSRIGETKQETLYSSSFKLCSSLKDLEPGQAVVSPAVVKSFVDPNKSIADIRYTNSACVINGVKNAVPVPYRFSHLNGLYLIPEGTELLLDDITTETWKCQPMVSCRSEYHDISVFHLSFVS